MVIKFGFYSGFALGGIFFAMMSSYALGFWYGSKLIEDGTENPVYDRAWNGGDVLTVFFSVVFGGFSLAQTTPCIKAFALAKQAGAKALLIIERKSKINVGESNGKRLEHLEGEIEFKDVTFAYPLKPDRNVLKGISFKVEKNKKTALVGESGCGKTTSMQLIERFYDIDNGSATIDGHQIKDLDLQWLRSQMGYVGQEPVLFATTIRENLKFAKEDATDEEIYEALKKANAKDFVDQLPDKLSTYVGTSGSALSGGQKQRLAIARAILKNPPILLLDEATSALDRKNELEIQATLDKVSEGRTTVCIAHRLTTIQNADKILVFANGEIIEQGVHEELIQKKGHYYALQKLQLKAKDESEDDPESVSGNIDVEDAEGTAIDGKKKELMSGEKSNYQDEEKKDELEEVKVKAKITSSKKERSHKKNPSDKKDEDYILEIKKEKTKEKLTDKELKELKKKEKEQKKKEEKEKKKKEKQIMSRLFSYNKEERCWLFLGIIVSLINGAIFPLFAVILSNMLDVFADPTASDFRDRADVLSLLFFISAIAALIFNSLQLGISGYVGESLTLKLRSDLFAKLLKFHVGWYDKSENSPGALTGKLSTDCTLVNSLTSTTLTISIQSLSSFLTGMIVAFIASWQLTLVTLAVSPLMVLTGKIQAEFNQGFS